MTSSVSTIRSAIKSYFHANRGSETGSSGIAARSFGRSSSVSSSLAGIEQSGVPLLRYQPLGDDTGSTASLLPVTVATLRLMPDPLQTRFAVPRVGREGGRSPLVETVDNTQSRVELWLHGGDDKSIEAPTSWLYGHFIPRRDALEYTSMVVQKATVLAEDYLRAQAKSTSSPLFTAKTSPGKNVQRQIAENLRGLRKELAVTARIFDGTPRGDMARRIGNEVAHAKKEVGREEALRIASQGMKAVLLASHMPFDEDSKPRRAHFGAGNAALQRGSESDGSQASTSGTSLPSVNSDSVFEDGRVSPSSKVAHRAPEAARNGSTSSFGSSIGRALRRIFSVPERTPGEKLRKLTIELRQTYDWNWPSERGVHAKKLLDEVVAKHRSDGDLTAYAYAKKHIGDVRAAAMSTSRQFYERRGPSRAHSSI